MEKARKCLEKKNPDYWDLRQEKRRRRQINSEKGDITEIKESIKQGTGIRVLEKGSIGFSYTEKDGKIKKTCKNAYKTAKTLENQEIKLSEEPIHREEYRVKTSKPEIEELTQIVKDTDSFSDQRIEHSRVTLRTEIPTQRFTNSEGSQITQNIPYGSLHITIKGRENSDKARAHTSNYFMNFNRDNIWKKAQRAKKETLKKLEKLLKADHIDQQKKTVVIDNELTGLFAHEAMGHALEADQENSFLANKKGEKIAPKKLNLTSDPTLKNKRGSYKYDDEGVKGRKTRLVEKGVLKNYMHSRKSAGKEGTKPTGNGRAQDYSYPPVVRMNNTYIEEGEKNFEEMIEDIEDGIYIKGFKGGSVSPSTGEYRFRSELGHKIKQGEIKKPVRSILLSGRILELLQKIESIGKDFKMNRISEVCGKNSQRKRVSSGAPHIKLKNFTVS